MGQRFDPLGIRASVNTYTYAANNPLTRFDAMGLFCGSGAGASGSGCYTMIYGVGGEVCAEVKCCSNNCGEYCCSYFKICYCVGLGGGASATASLAVKDCNVSVGFSSVGFGCGPCSVEFGSNINAKCCYCVEALKECT